MSPHPRCRAKQFRVNLFVQAVSFQLHLIASCCPQYKLHRDRLVPANATRTGGALSWHPDDRPWSHTDSNASWKRSTASAPIYNFRFCIDMFAVPLFTPASNLSWELARNPLPLGLPGSKWRGCEAGRKVLLCSLVDDCHLSTYIRYYTSCPSYTTVQSAPNATFLKTKVRSGQDFYGESGIHSDGLATRHMQYRRPDECFNSHDLCSLKAIAATHFVSRGMTLSSWHSPVSSSFLYRSSSQLDGLFLASSWSGLKIQTVGSTAPRVRNVSAADPPKSVCWSQLLSPITQLH